MEAEAGTRQPIDPGKRFRREQGLPVVPVLDGFRAFAILGIVLLHLMAVYLLPLSASEEFITNGILPNLVDILFILSGFVVFLPTVARRGDFGPVSFYAIRRAARLMPAFWLAIAVVLVLIAFWPESPAPPSPSISEVGIHSIAMHRPAELFIDGFNQGLSIDGPMWTLSLEMTFYLLLPLIAGIYFRHPLLGLLAALSVTVGWKLGVDNAAEIARFLGFNPSADRLIAVQVSAGGQFPAWAFHFALGMTAAWLYVWLRQRYRPEVLARRAPWIAVGALLALVPLMIKFGSYTSPVALLAPAVARTDIALAAAIPLAITILMLAVSLSPSLLQLPFAVSPVRRLGDISYGIYLIHYPVILFVGTLIATSDSALAAALNRPFVLSLIVVAIAVSYGQLSAKYLELPVRRWAHRYGRRAEAPSGRSAAGEPAPGP